MSNIEVQEEPTVSSTEQVYRSIVEHREMGRACSRATLRDATGLPLTIVDDRVKHLKNVGRIRLAGGVAGIFEPSEDRSEDRAISTTIMPNGRVKVEIGDTVLDLSMREARNLGAAMGGFALQFRGA
ncbi:MAG TPA: hypothetical protein VIL30_02620 [Ramlibacter sp.]|jgi:hypothetical protein